MTLSVLRRLWPLAAVTGLLALVAVAAAHSSLRFTRVEEPEGFPTLAEYPTDVPSPSFPPAPREVAPAEPATLPGWITTVALVLGGLVVAVVVALLLRVLLRDVMAGAGRRARLRPGPARSAEQTSAEVVAALDAGLVQLSDSDADPRRAVIACWVRLEQAAAAAGVPRQPGDTPTDLVSRLLTGASTRVSADVLAAFAYVYREARYATHTVDEAMRDEARAALARLRDELTVGVAA